MLWRGSVGANRVGVVDLGSGAVTALAEGSYPRYLAPGRIVIGASDGRVLVASYDSRTSRLSDNPVLILDDVQDEISNGTVQFAVSENGTFVYQPKQGGMDGLVWVDRSGRVAPIDSTLRGYFSSAVLSPDGSQIAVARNVSGGGQVWVKQLRTGAFSRLSQDLQDAARPAWSPDGRYVAFLATKDLHRTAWIARADGSDSPRPIVGGTFGFDEVGFDRAGRYTLFRSEGSASGTRHLLVFEKGVDSVPRILLKTPNDNYAMSLSPDGRWLAYVSDESGNAEVYVRPFPGVNSAKFAISIGGGLEPLWRRDGTELYFRDPRGAMHVVAVSAGKEFEHGAPRLLFSRPGMALQDFYRSYDIHPDGKRFLMLSSGDAEARSLSLILNWLPASPAGRESQP
jgi:dipeptidyl aminopeptidase/acylaminoacyl peptidase